uniref:DUF4408 domain-containing protein n=1 Tax=Meloidogyne hapla TaxID=6305 RepID=A0A1I8BC52_MELHA
MVQQQQEMTSNKVNTPSNKHNALLFLMVNSIQILNVLIVLIQALSTTELRGSFYYADQTNIRNMLLKSDGQRCEQFVIYNAEPSPQENWDERLRSSGYATLKDRAEKIEGNKDPSSGRILTILERSMKVTADEGNSTTGELKMRISLLFEWKTGHGQLDMLRMPDDAENLTETILQESQDIASSNMTTLNMTSTNKGTANTAKIPLPSIASEANSVETEETEYVEENKLSADSDSKTQPRFPNGTHAYKFNKMEGVQNNQPADNVFDPFKYVAMQMLIFSLFSFLQLILQLCRCVFSDNNGHYSICSAALVVLYLFEALYACEMMLFEESTGRMQKEVKSEASATPKNNNAVAPSTDDTTSILLPFTVGKLGGNIQQAKLVREDFCMITVKEN